MQELLVRPATDVAQLLRRREVASRELTEALLARVEAVNPVLNAVVELRGEQALAEAAAADQAAARGDELGPLHGLPMTVKDGFDVAGLHTTWGNPAFAEYVAASDATVVGRLRRAGAVVNRNKKIEGDPSYYLHPFASRYNRSRQALAAYLLYPDAHHQAMIQASESGGGPISGWRWPGRSPSSRRYSCSTNRSAPSTPRSARSCATGSAASTTTSA